MNKKVETIKKELDSKTPKQVRTLRNQLNNRIKSFEDEVKFGRKLPKLAESHALHGLTIGECKDLLIFAKQGLKSIKNDSHEDDEE